MTTKAKTTTTMSRFLAVAVFATSSTSSGSRRGGGGAHAWSASAPAEAFGATAAAAQDVLRHVKEQHEQEFAAGAAVFGVSSSSSSSSSSAADDDAHAAPDWSGKDDDDDDDDEDTTRLYYHVHNVGVGNGGPSEGVLRNGHCVYQTRRPVLSEQECRYWKEAARRVMADERAAATRPSSSRFSGERTNAQLGEARLSALPADAIDKLRALLQTTVYPMLTSRFGIGDGDDDDCLTVYDGLILGNIGPSKSQPIHRDASLLTINIALSCPQTDFDGGGGTYVEALVDDKDVAVAAAAGTREGGGGGGLPLIVDQGVALCHAGGVMHAGAGIRHGERWQLVLFVLARNEPQIARRAHALALERMQRDDDDKDLEGAQTAIEVGLSVAPDDHLLHKAMGQLHHYRNNPRLAMRSLVQTAQLYPASPTAAMGVAKMLLAVQQRPRAALRWLDDHVLSSSSKSSIGSGDGDGNDLRPGAFGALQSAGWEARATAARCAMLCAERQALQPPQQATSSMAWSLEHLPVAMERIRLCMRAAPHDARLPALLARAQQLLDEATRRSQTEE